MRMPPSPRATAGTKAQVVVVGLHIGLLVGLAQPAWAAAGHLASGVAVPSAAAAVDHEALRIMPLGDSITQWQCGLLGNASSAADGRGDVASFGGYRGPLFESLQRQWAGFAVSWGELGVSVGTSRASIPYLVAHTS